MKKLKIGFFGTDLIIGYDFIAMMIFVAALYPKYFWLVVALYASVLVHELGHYLEAKAFDCKCSHIALTCWGGYTRLMGEADTPRRRVLISASGPFYSLMLGSILLVASLMIENDFLLKVALINIVILCFANMLPIFPMDGGHVMKNSLLLNGKDKNTSEKATYLTGIVLSVLLLTASIVFKFWIIGAMFFIFVLINGSLLHALSRNRENDYNCKK